MNSELMTHRQISQTQAVRFRKLAWPMLPVVLRTAQCLVGHRGHAEDLAQETMIKAMRAIDSFEDGIHPRTLYELRDAGELEQLARGVYRLTELPPLSAPDLAIVGKRVPQGVICLISALAFHELTTQIPHVVHIALPRNAWTPKLKYPPIQVYHFSIEAFDAGIERHTIDGIDVRVYSAEKTLADCFKYRNKIGLDVTLEALRAYRDRRGPQLQKVLEYARVCRVEKIVRPYLEASV